MSDVKHNDHTLPIANWLRDQINETLARYDIPSDVYDTDILIDALCVCAVDKAQFAIRARLEAATEERDEWVRDVWTARGFQAEAEARAERAEAALATARRDAWQIVLDNIREWAWPEDGTYPPEEQAIQDAERGTVEFIESEIRALANEAPE